jgi:hypothetical protein
LTRATYAQLDLRSDDWFVDAEMVLSARRRRAARAYYGQEPGCGGGP